jgi:hypothetical protein
LFQYDFYKTEPPDLTKETFTEKRVNLSEMT